METKVELKKNTGFKQNNIIGITWQHLTGNNSPASADSDLSYLIVGAWDTYK